METTQRTTSRLWALVRQRCPRCCRGPVFHGVATMYDHCPVCGVKFEREEGYFLGAMYFSYFMAVACLSAFYVGWYLLLPAWSPEMIFVLSVALFVPLVPVVFRYSRIVWMYFDQWAWPTT